jgi:hypothetical protein
VKHRATPTFWYLHRRLAPELRQLADDNFKLLKTDSRHPSLHLKKVGNYWSVRIGLSHRALAIEHEGDLIWFWVGHHRDYDRLLANQ